jgi:photoactive yellow protein
LPTHCFRSNFSATRHATRTSIEQLKQSEIDALPFGVIHLDREGTVLFYSASEARQSGNPNSPLGENFYALSCMGGDDFRGRIVRAQEQGAVDLEVGWPRDYGGVTRDLRIRVQSARDGGVWLCIERDFAAGAQRGAAQ